MLPEKNKIYEVEILGLGDSGEGVGRIDNFTIFVEGALPAEKVSVEVVEVKKNYAVGKLKKILRESPARVQPVCRFFPGCGSCQLQHLSYSAQLEIKKQKVIDAVERIGKIFNADIFDTIGAENFLNYRNKMQFPVGSVGSVGRLVDGQMSSKNTTNLQNYQSTHLIAGCYAKKSHKIIDVENCLIQREGNNKILRAVKKVAKKFNLEPYNEKTGAGFLRHIMGRVGFNCELMIVIVTATKKFPHEKNFIAEILKELPEVTSIQQNIQPAKNNVILGKETKILFGKKNITEKIFDLKFNISARSFFQVNTAQAEILYQTALDFAELSGSEIVIDAYCGTGTLSLFLAKSAKKVFGIEIEKSAIDDAKKNSAENKITNAEFIVGDAVKIIPELYAKKIFADVVIVDPPRAGCDKKVLDTFAAMKPKKIIYVSCNPATLARDLKILQDLNYSTKKIQPVDMFPFTSHIETVALIEKN